MPKQHEKTVLISTDRHGNVLGIGYYESVDEAKSYGETNVPSPQITMKPSEYATKDSKIYQIPQSYLPDETWRQIFLFATFYIFDGKSFTTRPALWLTLENEEQYPLKNNTRIVPTNTDISMKVIYDDPQNIGYNKRFHYLKVKDRYGLVSQIPETINLDPTTNEAKFIVRSSDSGLAKIRVKDNKYLCAFAPMVIRFRNN